MITSFARTPCQILWILSKSNSLIFDRRSYDIVKNYLESPSTDQFMLKNFPPIEKLYRRMNVATPSSVPIERFFSIGSHVFGRRRFKLSDPAFEKQAILYANRKKKLLSKSTWNLPGKIASLSFLELSWNFLTKFWNWNGTGTDRILILGQGKGTELVPILVRRNPGNAG